MVATAPEAAGVAATSQLAPNTGGLPTSAATAAAAARRTANLPGAGERGAARMTRVSSPRESVTVRLNEVRRAGMIEFVDRKILLKHPPARAPA